MHTVKKEKPNKKTESMLKSWSFVSLSTTPIFWHPAASSFLSINLLNVPSHPYTISTIVY